MRNVFLACLVCLSVLQILQAQSPTSYLKQKEAYEQHLRLRENSRVASMEFTSIGPVIMGGRVVDIEVNPRNRKEWLIAYASSGLWYTKNAGQSFDPIFDTQASMSIGDIAMDWEHSILWVGTGENNSSRSSYSGTGIYKSLDLGKTWEWSGLGESQHIGRILLHPTNPNVIHVAVLGNLYTSSKDRGVYLTEDGGKTWQQTLFVNENTGCIDVSFHPKNPDVILAALWDKGRKAWDFTPSGAHSGLYRSMNGGRSYEYVKDSGLPQGVQLGRMGISASPDPSIFYAVVDHQKIIESKKEDNGSALAPHLSKEFYKSLSKKAFLNLKDDHIQEFLKQYRFPEKYTAAYLKEEVKADKLLPKALYEYLTDANTLLFEGSPVGAEVYKSTDAGLHWTKTHSLPLNDVFFTYGYYFGQIRVHPKDTELIYILGVPVLASKDGGASFTAISNELTHADHHALWMDPEDPDWMLLGNDGGVCLTQDGGKHWESLQKVAVGQFYSIAYDFETPFNVYGGLQDNGVWKGSSISEVNENWKVYGKNPFENLMGGDGMQVQVDPDSSHLVYTGYQFGNYYALNIKENSEKRFRVTHELGETPLRFNWQSPIYLSKHSSSKLYFGANKLFRSQDKGNNWESISPDLTAGGHKGTIPFGTLTTIHESPVKEGLIYTGSDDGTLSRSNDDGLSWEKIGLSLPKNLYVSRIYASSFAEGRVYVSLNGYRSDTFDAYVYVSEDYGKSFKPISSNLPAQAVNVIKEDPFDERILYVGTDHGLFVSFDRGENWESFGSSLPMVPVHDLDVHPRDSILLIATHGRSMYTLNVKRFKELNSLDPSLKSNIFAIDNLTYSPYWGRSWSQWNPVYEPSLAVDMYCVESEEATVQIIFKGECIHTEKITLHKGLYTYSIGISIDNDKESKYFDTYGSSSILPDRSAKGVYYLLPGEYTLRVKLKSEEKEQLFQILK